MISIITTSYNQLGTLKLLLASLERQTVRDFEVVVADDGSSDGTAEFCTQYRALPLVFVTQPDDGYRKARICNEALSRSRGDYLVFLDSDVIVAKTFLEDHLALRREGAYVCGRRVDLGPEFTRSVSEDQVRSGFYDGLRMALILSAWRGDTEGWKRAWRVTTPWLRRVMGYGRPIDILGSNFSAWKTDMLEVNGFNEALEAYWGEDGDLFVRLRNSGKRAINGKGMCVQYHVFHKRRAPTPGNVALVAEKLKRTDYTRAEKGYSARFSATPGR